MLISWISATPATACSFGHEARGCFSSQLHEHAGGLRPDGGAHQGRWRWFEPGMRRCRPARAEFSQEEFHGRALSGRGRRGRWLDGELGGEAAAARAVSLLGSGPVPSPHLGAKLATLNHSTPGCARAAQHELVEPGVWQVVGLTVLAVQRTSTVLRARGLPWDP